MKDIPNDTMQAIMDDYYNNNLKVKEIIEKYDLDVPPGKLVTLFPPKETEDVCPYCGVKMLSKRKSRGAYVSRISSDSYCPECSHTSERCNCTNCQKAKMEEEKRKRELIEKNYPLQPELSIDSIDFESKLYLGCLLKNYKLSDNGLIGPFDRAVSGAASITGNSEWDNEILTGLFKKKIISVSDKSPISAFPSDKFPRVFYLYQVIYKINLSNEDIKDLKDFKFFDADNEEQKIKITQLWHKINYSIVKDYLITEMERCRFDYSFGTKSNNLINEMVDRYSPSQCLYIINYCTGPASKKYLQREMTRKHAANSIITHCYNYINKADEEKWNISDALRPNYFLESPMEIFLYYNILHINNKGFKSVVGSIYN